MKNKTLGFTLTETLVAIVIGMISVAAAFSAYNYFNKSYASISQKAAISKSAREALSLIARDLRNAGYFDPSYPQHLVNIGCAGSKWQAEQHLIGVNNKRYGKYRQADQLNIFFTSSPKDRIRIYYRLLENNLEKGSYFLAREVWQNAICGTLGGRVHKELSSNEDMLVPYVEDFQVVLKDIDGKILMPVCSWCASVEQSQGSGDKVGNKNRGQDNMKKVHTAEVYLTVRSPKEVYSKARRIKIKNGEGSYGSEITIPADKYHRETFFVSVHTRNLATHQVKIASSGQSIGVGTGYNK